MNIAGAQPLPERERVRLVRLKLSNANFAADVQRGLTSRPKRVDSKYFYDDLGSILFEAVSRVPEYYVARAEEEILVSRSAEIVKTLRQPNRIIELGCGSARKTRPLIRDILFGQRHVEYVPIDIDVTLLAATADAFAAEFETLSVTALAGTFEDAIDHLAQRNSESNERTLVLFLGSTIGNLEAPARRDLLHSLRMILRPGDSILLGADAVKDESVLVPAYDDALGVTAAFNRNLLIRMNRELGGTFNITTFCHLARYDTDYERTEMHLVSTVQQRVRVAGIEVDFEQGESIHTENSYKFTSASIKILAGETGFELAAIWSDAQDLFRDYLLTAL